MGTTSESDPLEPKAGQNAHCPGLLMRHSSHEIAGTWSVNITDTTSDIYLLPS
jgi:hypothetical protein